MMKKVLKHLWWPSIHRDVRQYVRGCQMCQASKVNTHPTAPPITPHDVASNPFPFKQVSVDLVTDLPLLRFHRFHVLRLLSAWHTLFLFVLCGCCAPKYTDTFPLLLFFSCAHWTFLALR